MTKKFLFIFCVTPFFAFAELSNLQSTMLNIVDPLINMTTNTSATITTISSDSSYILTLAESIPNDSEYYQIASHIIDLANHIDSMSSYLSGVNAQRYENLIALRETISNMSLDSIGLDNITNQLKYVCTRLDDIYSLFYSQQFESYLYNIQADLDLIQTYTFSIDSDVETIKTKVSNIFTYISDMIVNVRSIDTQLETSNTHLIHIRNYSRIISNSLTDYVTSWNNHANHQDSFYSNMTYNVSQIISNLSNLSISNINANVDFTPITGVITNIPEYWEMILPSINDYTKERSFNSYFYPKINNQGQVRSIAYNADLGSQIFPDAFEEGNLHDYATYNPFMYLILFSYYNTTALSAIANWGYLINSKFQSILNQVTNISEKVNSIDATTKYIEDFSRATVVAFSTNNFILGQQLSKLDYMQSLFSNNVPVASLRVDNTQSWYEFFTNFYLNVSLGWDESGNTAEYSSWYANTNWFNRIEALLAALVFSDNKNFNTNGVGSSTSSVSSTINQSLESIQSFVEPSNDLTDPLRTTGNNLIQTIQSFNDQIRQNSELPSTFTMFLVHDTGNGESGSGFDMSVYTSLEDSPMKRFSEFCRMLTTVCWIALFLFFSLKYGFIFLRFIFNLIYFVYNVFSAMLGG